MTELTSHVIMHGNAQTNVPQVSSDELLQWMAQQESLSSAGGLKYINATLTELDARTGATDGEYALLLTTADEGGVYEYTAGVWGKVADIPAIFIQDRAAEEIVTWANAANLAALEASSAALESRDLAAGYADDAAAFAGFRDVQSASVLELDASISYYGALAVVAGDIFRARAEGFSYEVAAEAATDHHVETAGGVKLYVILGERGYNVKAFNAKGDGITDDTLALQKALDVCFEAGGGDVYIPAGHYITTDNLFRRDHVWVKGQGKASLIENTSFVFLSSFVIVDGWLHEKDWHTQTYYNLDPVTKGSKTLTLSTAVDAAIFEEGQVMVVFRGFPGHNDIDNAIYSEIVRVMRSDRITGEVDIDIRAAFNSNEKMGTSIGADWDILVSYSAGDRVWDVSTSAYYGSITDSNLGNAPTGSTDANWQKETIALTLATGPSSVDDIDSYLCDGGGVERIAVKNRIPQWQARSGVLGATYRDIWVEESATLFGGNAFNRCLFDNIQGNFRQGAFEFAEGAYKNIVTNIKGTWVESDQTPKDNIITCSRDGCRISNFDIEVSGYTFFQLILAGSKSETAETVIRNGTIKSACSGRVIEFRAGMATIEGVTFIGDGTACSRAIDWEDRGDRNRVHGCEFYNYPFSANIVNMQVGLAQLSDQASIKGNKFYGPLSTPSISLFGPNGEFSDNYIEGLGNPNWNGSHLNTWKISGNTKASNEPFDKVVNTTYGNEQLTFVDTRAYVRSSTAATITLPDVTTIPLFHTVHIYNADSTVTNTTATFGSEKIQPKRTGGSQNTVSVLPESGDTYWWDGSVWLRSVG